MKLAPPTFSHGGVSVSSGSILRFALAALEGAHAAQRLSSRLAGPAHGEQRAIFAGGFAFPTWVCTAVGVANLAAAVLLLADPVAGAGMALAVAVFLSVAYVTRMRVPGAASVELVIAGGCVFVALGVANTQGRGLHSLASGVALGAVAAAVAGGVWRAPAGGGGRSVGVR